MEEVKQMAETATGDLNQDVPNWDGIDTKDDDTPETDAPETEADTEEAAPDAPEADQPKGEDGEAEKADAGKQDTPEQTDQFVLKHLDKTVAVSREQVISLAQKGMDYDRIREKYDEVTTKLGTPEQISADREKLSFFGEIARQSGFRDVDDLIENVQAKQLSEREGLDEAVAMQRVRLDRKERELKAKEEKLSAEKTAEASQIDAGKQADEKRQADFSEFFQSEYGQMKPDDIPQEVWGIYGDGTKGYTLLQAVQKHENARLKAKMAALEKSKENKARSTGSADSAGKEKASDPWLSDLEARM